MTFLECQSEVKKKVMIFRELEIRIVSARIVEIYLLFKFYMKNFLLDFFVSL